MENDSNTNSVQQNNPTNYPNIKIHLEKVCYFPGETISGQITFTPNPGLKITNLTDPKVIFNIIQHEEYSHSLGESSICAKQDNELLEFKGFYSNFVNANISNGLTLPFDIILPINSKPTCLLKPFEYCRHDLTISIPSLNIKKIVAIIIKNSSHFTKENKLFKSPSTVFKYIDKKKFLSKKGKIAAFLKIPKNSFNYGEIIPFEVTLNCSELNLKINEIQASIERIIKYNEKNNPKDVRHIEKSEILIKSFKIQEKDDKLSIIKGEIQFPNSSKHYSSYPPRIYEEANKIGTEDLSNQLKSYRLYACTYGGLIAIEYKLKVTILFNSSFTFNEHLSIPIDFYSLPEEINEESLNKNIQNEEINQKYTSDQIINANDLNHNNNLEQNNSSSCTSPPLNMNNIVDNNEGDNEDKNKVNSTNEKDNKIDTNFGFEIIDENSFYDILTLKNNNNVAKK